MWRPGPRTIVTAMTDTPLPSSPSSPPSPTPSSAPPSWAGPTPPPPGDTLQDAQVPSQDDPIPEPPPVRPRLVRHPDDKVIGGVCAAFGRYTSTDPVLWRVLVAAMALFGGAGLALYALGWLLVPRSDLPGSFVERRLRKADRSVSIGGAVLVFVLAVVVLGLVDGAKLVVLAVVVGLGYLVVRERGATGTPTSAGTTDAATWAPSAPSSYGVTGTSSQAAWAAGTAAPSPAAPAAPRPRSALGVLTVSAATLVAGGLLLARAFGADGITAARVLAAALVVVGAGLVVGAFWGRARWLLAVGAALALALGAVGTVAALEEPFAGGVGERTWVPTASTGPPFDFSLGAGEAVLDLRELEAGAVRTLEAEIGAGSLLVLVPDDLRVSVTTDVGLGELRQSEGDADRSTGRRISRPVDEVLVVGPQTGPVLDLRLEVGLGEIEVRRVQG